MHSHLAGSDCPYQSALIARPHFTGAGPQGPTLALLNVALLSCILSLAALLAVFGGTYTALVPHLVALLFLAVGLAVSVNW